MIVRRLFWFALLTGLAVAIAAQSALAVNYPDKPRRSDFFVDEAGLLDEEAKTAINGTANALLREERIPLFVVTIRSLSSYDAGGLGIEKYATRLFNVWGIGSQQRNYGMLLLVSVDDRKARIELGAGFEHYYDRRANDVMQSLIIPAFRRGDFAIGISDGVRRLDAMARGLGLPKITRPWWYLPSLIVGPVLLGWFIWNLFRTGRSGWAWALIAGLALFVFFVISYAVKSDGFGGGSSDGGGATGDW